MSDAIDEFLSECIEKVGAKTNNAYLDRLDSEVIVLVEMLKEAKAMISDWNVLCAKNWLNKWNEKLRETENG